MKFFNSPAYAVFRIRDFRLFLSGRFLLTLALQMQAVIVGWQVYELTRDPLSLGLIGLAEAIPFISVALYAGHVADRFERKRIIVLALSLYLICAAALLLIAAGQATIQTKLIVSLIYIVIFISGITRAFFYPAQVALMSQIVPRELYVNSSTWNSTAWHIAAVAGPAVGGLVYGWLGMMAAYRLVLALSLLSFVIFIILRRYRLPEGNSGEKLMESLKGGLRFVFRNQIILGALSLDMFAVLFGGAVAMLPVFAAEVLKVGPQGLGVLRAAPAAGAVLMALVLAHRPPNVNAGKKLLFAVAGFGLCMIGFALSTSFYLSVALLALSGVFDNVSVIIRHSLIQIFTPDEMRGRVASVNSIFIGSSNELGSFESGLAARIMGLVPSVVFGGFMTLLTVSGAARVFPRLRKLSIN